MDFIQCSSEADETSGNLVSVPSGGGGGGGDSHIKWTGMLVGNFEFNP